MSKPFIVAVTGGIASGKSTVAQLFAAKGAGVIDTDAISHELTGPRGAAVAAIQQAFGDEFISADMALDRAAMRALVFSDPAAKRRLEAILHPLIMERVREEIAQRAEPYVLVLIPLLFETGARQDFVQRVLVVDCAEERQIERARQRSSLPEAQIRRIIATQVSRAQRRAGADDIIANDGGIQALELQVSALDRLYRSLAGGVAPAEKL